MRVRKGREEQGSNKNESPQFGGRKISKKRRIYQNAEMHMQGESTNVSHLRNRSDDIPQATNVLFNSARK